MSGLRRMGDKEMAYLSTSNYLRQKTGREKTTKNKYDNPTSKPYIRNNKLTILTCIRIKGFMLPVVEKSLQCSSDSSYLMDWMRR